MESAKTSGLQVIVGQGTGLLTDDSPGWDVRTDDGYLYFQLDAGGTCGISQLQASDLNAAVCNVTNTWHHVVVTYDGSEEASGVAFYIDGAAQTLDSCSSGLYDGGLTASGDPTIGATPAPGNSCYYSGDLNELDIFNRVLAFADVPRRSTPVERATTAQPLSPAWWPATTWTTPRPLLSPTTREMETTARGTAPRPRRRWPAKFSAR